MKNRLHAAFKRLFTESIDELGFLGLALFSITILSWKHDLISHYQIDRNYLGALKQNFLQYAYFFHLKPPGLLIKDKLLSVILRDNLIGTYNFYLLSFLNTLSSFWIFKIIKSFTKQSFFSFLFSIFFLFLTFIFIFWRDGLHYDHYNIFLHVFIIYSLFIIVYEEASKLRYLILALALSLNLLIYSPSIVTLFFSIILLMFLKKRESLKYLLIPIFIFGLLIFKNHIAHNNLSPSSLSGSTRLTNAFYFHEGYKGVGNFIKNRNYPDWWKRCFHNAYKTYHEFVGPLYGTCFFKDDKRTYDFDLLLNRIGPIENENLKAVIQRDKELYRNIPNIFSGPVPEFATGFSVIYGKTAAKIWKDIVFKNPKLFISFFRRTITYFTFERGASFYSGNSYEPKYMPLKLPFPTIFKYFLKLNHLFLLVSPLIFFTGFLLYFKNKASKEVIKTILFSLFNWINFLSIIFILGALVCCENDRMYASLIPYLLTNFLLTCVSLVNIGKSLRKA